MGRRRKLTKEMVLGLLMLGVILSLLMLFLAVVSIPFVLIGGYIYYVVLRSRNKLKHEAYKNGKWLTDQENEQWQTTNDTITQCNYIIQQTLDVAKAEGISLNLDGTISARSKKGKELRQTIEETELTLHKAHLVVHELKNLMNDRYISLRETESRKPAFQFSLITYIALSIVVAIIAHTNVQLGLHSPEQYPMIIFSDIQFNSQDMRAISAVSMSSVIVFFGIYASKRASIKRKYL